MNRPLPALPGGWRLLALFALAFLILAPVVWIAWALSGASILGDTLEAQRGLLAGLERRVAALQSGGAGAGAADGQRVFLPGETSAVAGAALQKSVAETVETTGARVIETEFARVENAEADPGRVDLRVSFDAEIVSLQQILFNLESGLPLLVVRGLDIQTTGDEAAAANPPLRVTMLLSGYWEASP